MDRGSASWRGRGRPGVGRGGESLRSWRRLVVTPVRCRQKPPWGQVATRLTSRAQQQKRSWDVVGVEESYCKGLAEGRVGENRGGKIGHRPKRAGERMRLEHGSEAARWRPHFE